MKYSSVALFLIITISSSAQRANNNLPTPPNCVWLRDSLFIDKTEIANIHWLEYLHCLQIDSSIMQYKKAMPDTSVWLTTNDTLKWKYYLRDPGYRYYPVVGITKQQVENFCRWRSQMVNVRLEDPMFREKYLNGHNTKLRYTFRLPTEEEWGFAAMGGLDSTAYPFGFKDYLQKISLKDDWKFYYQHMLSNNINTDDFKSLFKDFLKKGKEPFFNCLLPFGNLFNYGALSPLSSARMDYIDTSLSKFVYQSIFKPNAYGIYDMIGNVSEMVAETGVSKGGSWAVNLEDSKLIKQQKYTKPTSWLGFRCACEIISKN